MRERGAQSRRARDVDPRRPGQSSRASNPWQAIAIVALVFAAAGWTTVAVLALREPTAVAEANPTASEPLASDDSSEPPVEDTHDAPELEALLPTGLNGTTLALQSWTGEAILTDDGWSTSMTAFVKKAGKTPTDLHSAQAYDPAQVLDGTVGVYSVAGVEGTALAEALAAAWKTDYPDMQVSQVTLGGKQVTKCDFGEDTIDSYLYVRDGVVFDIETTDAAIATAALAALPAPGASRAPASSGAPASAAPSPSPVPSLSPS